MNVNWTSHSFPDANQNSDTLKHSPWLCFWDFEKQKLMYSGSQVEDEFVETAYYKDLNCTDKQHHQVGS